MESDPRLVAKLALHYQLVTREQLAACLRLPEAQRSLEDVLLAQGLITPEQHVWIAQAVGYHVARRSTQPDPNPPAETPVRAVEPPREVRSRAPTAAVWDGNEMAFDRDVSGLELDLGSGGQATAQTRFRAEQRAAELNWGATPDEERAAKALSGERASEFVAVPAKPQPKSSVTPTSVEAVRGASPSRGTRAAALFNEAITQGASDIHLHAAQSPMIRVHGQLAPLGGRVPLSGEEMSALVDELLDREQQAALGRDGEVAFSYVLAGAAHLRGRAYRQRGGTDLVLRVLPLEVPRAAALGLPAELLRLALGEGLLLLAGPPGAGRSTTLAALIDHILREQPRFVALVAADEEFTHRSVRGLVRRLPRREQTVADTVRAAVGLGADVIAIDELNDPPAVEAAIDAALAGRLVIATFPARSTRQAITRLRRLAGVNDRPGARQALSSALRGLALQRLVRRQTSGSVAAVEVLTIDGAIAAALGEELPDRGCELATRRGPHLRPLDEALRALCQNQIIASEDALRIVDDVNRSSDG